MQLLPERFVCPTWNCFVERTSLIYFYRIFRMNSRVFSILCEYVEIGVDVFKSEHKHYIIYNDKNTTSATKFYGGLMCGELKLAITLRLLAGSSYLDLCSIFYIGSTSAHNAFHEGIQ